MTLEPCSTPQHRTRGDSSAQRAGKTEFRAVARIITIPLEPPSVNHYKLPNKGGGWRLSEQARAFKDAVCLLARACDPCPWPYHSVSVVYVLGPKTRLDVDNGAKLVLDGLQASGIIRNDSDVLNLTQHKRRCRDPRDAHTIVSIEPFEGSEYLP